MNFGLLAPKDFVIQIFDYERTWWRLLQKRVMRTKLYIYDFTTVINTI